MARTAAGQRRHLVLTLKAAMETYPTWIRLHPDSTDDTMVTSVQARIHDPLWLLGRQWQFGELLHDGGATPITVRVEGTSSPLTRLRGGLAAATATGSRPIKAVQTPLETLVERETVPETGLDNLRLRTEAGQQFVRMMRAAGMNARISFWVAESPFVRPAIETDPTRGSGSTWWTDACQTARNCRVSSAPACSGQLAPIEGDEARVLRAWVASGGSAIRSGAGWTTDVGSGACRVCVHCLGDGSDRRSGPRRTRARQGPARVVRLRARAQGPWAPLEPPRHDARSGFRPRSILPACPIPGSGPSRIPAFDSISWRCCRILKHRRRRRR